MRFASNLVPATILASIASPAAQALDLKVDAPIAVNSAGTSNSLPPRSLSNTEIVTQANSTEPVPASNRNALDLPPIPTILLSREPEPDENEEGKLVKPKRQREEPVVTAATDSSTFPSPECLQDNVRFWEQVYAELDTEEAFLHDRNDLGRIFTRVTLPASPSLRKVAVQQTTELYRKKLLAFAEKLKSPSTWDTHERELAKQFKDGTLTRANVVSAAKNLRIQTGLRSRFEAGVFRSLKHLPTIHKVVSDSGLPLDIMMLPHVESSFVTHAKSKVGAGGLWQIMPGTMRLLMGPDSVHKRGDVHTSTVAATKLLRQNFEATQSWPLALTAYNHGLNGILRGVRETGSRDLCEIIANYQSPSFRFASSNFYAQFLAARNIAGARYKVLAEAKPKGSPLRQVLLSAKGNL